MTTAMQTPPRRTRSKLQEASLADGPMLLLRSIRGFSSNRSMLWLATVPLALFGLGVFNLSAHANELPELNAAFLANNLWLLVATILVIFMSFDYSLNSLAIRVLYNFSYRLVGALPLPDLVPQSSWARGPVGPWARVV